MTQWVRAATLVATVLVLPLTACARETVYVPADQATLPPASRTPTIGGRATSQPAPQGTDLELIENVIARATTSRLYFGHQSIGSNVISGINLLAQANGMERPNYINAARRDTLPINGGFFAHGRIGRNGHPAEKLTDFAAALRAGLGSQIEVAVMKFGHIDVRSRTNVNQVFTQYRRIMRELEKEFPRVTFLHATVPLQVSRHAADNLARSRYNRLVREEYGRTGRLWDIAAIESTQPDGKRVIGRRQGTEHEALYDRYTDDGTHLNESGAPLAAGALLKLIARAPRS